MFESFVTTFVVCFVVIGSISNAPIFLAVTEAQDRAQQLRTSAGGTAIVLCWLSVQYVIDGLATIGLVTL